MLRPDHGPPQRGLLEDTLVIWGGEFGRTVYSQGTLKEDNYGRDHHPRCYSMWLAGGGVKAGTVYGETDDFSYNITKDPVHQRDLHATILNLFGLNHDAFTFRHQGLDQKLVGRRGARPRREGAPGVGRRLGLSRRTLHRALASDRRPEGSPQAAGLSPESGVLPPVLGIVLCLDQRQGFLADSFILHGVI